MEIQIITIGLSWVKRMGYEADMQKPPSSLAVLAESLRKLAEIQIF